MSGGVRHGEAPPYRGRCPACKGGVKHVRDPYSPPQHSEASENIQMHMSKGHIGVSECLGVYMYRGHKNIWGVQM